MQRSDPGDGAEGVVRRQADPRDLVGCRDPLRFQKAAHMTGAGFRNVKGASFDGRREFPSSRQPLAPRDGDGRRSRQRHHA